MFKIIIKYESKSQVHRIWIAHVESWVTKCQLKFYPRDRYDPVLRQFVVFAEVGDVLRWGSRDDETYNSVTVGGPDLVDSCGSKDLGRKFFLSYPHNFSDHKRYKNPDNGKDDGKDESIEPSPAIETSAKVTLKRVERQLSDYTTAELMAELRLRGIWFEN